ncbi:MAG: FadR/GntR family transcriptional regulator [Ahrensia sp.]
MPQELFSEVSHLRTADEVCDQIEVLVLEGVLRVGDKLPGERELAHQFNVSRPVLRNALKSLESKGLLETHHGGGTFVADVIGDVFSRTMLELIAKHDKATADYLEYRREVEAIAADLAARRATQYDKELLGDIMARMTEAHKKDDFHEEAALDVEFHQAVCETAHNIILMHTLRSCYRLLSTGAFFSRSLVYTFPGARDQLLAQHREIYEAIIAGDPPRASRAAAAHMEFVEKSKRDAEKVRAWKNVSKLRSTQRLAKT